MKYRLITVDEMGAQTSKGVGGIQKACIWKADRSPACRSVMMTVDAINLNITEVDLDLDKGDHTCPEIVAMNPHKTLPIYKDRDVILTDSHVIGAYLATRFCVESPLYPKKAAARAIQDQWLHYNNGTIYPKYRAAAYPMLYENCGYVLPGVVREIEVTYGNLETELVGNTYFGGAHATLADIALVSTISTLNVIVPIDPARFPQLCNWLWLMAEKSFYKTANAKGLDEFCYRLASNIASDRIKGQQRKAPAMRIRQKVKAYIPIPKQVRWSDSHSRRSLHDPCNQKSKV